MKLLALTFFLSAVAGLAQAPNSIRQSVPNRAVTAQAVVGSKQLEEIINEIETLRLARNKVYLYRQAADALASSQPAEASSLLLSALDDLDNAEANLRAEEVPDPHRLQELEFARRPVILQLVRINQAEGLRVLEQPQSADNDMEFQRLVYEQLGASDSNAVLQSALRKLGYGATPATVAAYAVLQRRDAENAKLLAADVVARLSSQSQIMDPNAVAAAFALLRLLRSDEGTRAPRIIVNPELLDDASVRTLFSFIGEALLSAKQPEMLILPETAKVYVDALERYAPLEAKQVEQLPFAQPGAKSLLLSKPTDSQDELTQATPASSQSAQAQNQFLAQLRETGIQLTTACIKLQQVGTPDKDALGKIVGNAIGEANQSIAMGRSFASTLKPEEFRENEYELYSGGPLDGVLASTEALLESYATIDPAAAFHSAAELDGPDMQIAVKLQLALHPPRLHRAQ